METMETMNQILTRLDDFNPSKYATKKDIENIKEDFFRSPRHILNIEHRLEDKIESAKKELRDEIKENRKDIKEIKSKITTGLFLIISSLVTAIATIIVLVLK